jgi:predicted ATP-grasp superfamily ATP-dependent carboligase
MQVADTSTPVVVLEAVNHGPLGIVRSLGRLGVATYVADAAGRSPASFSRYCRRTFRVDIRQPVAAVRALLEVGREIGRRPILIPTTDDGSMFVADHAAALREGFLFPEMPATLVRDLCNKKRMHFLAHESGIPTAQALFPQCREDVRRFAEDATFPVMLKGIDGLRLWRRGGERMFIVRSPTSLLDAYDALEDPDEPNLMVQEYIPGGDDTVWMFNGYFDDRSECRVGFTGKKIRQYPVHRGATTLGICLPNETVARTTRDFMKAVGYRGILDIGYRFDARDGQYKVLDVNPRVGATFRLFVGTAGLDVVRALYLDLTGQPVPADAAREGRRWLVENLDLASSLRYRREGALTARSWLRSLRGVDESAYLAADDLLPLVPMCAGGSGEVARRLYGRMRRRVGGAQEDRHDGAALASAPAGLGRDVVS